MSPRKGSRKKAAKKPRKRLTVKQEAFTQEYIANGGNGVKAAQAAGYQGEYHTLGQVAYENVNKPEIQSRIRQRLDGLAATKEEVLNLLGDHMRADVADFRDCVDDNGGLDLEKAKAKGISRNIKKLKIKTRFIPTLTGAPPIKEVEAEIELHDSQAAARTIGEYHGLKQAAKTNDEDREREREMIKKVHDEITRLIQQGWSLPDAQRIVVEADPEAQKWLH